MRAMLCALAILCAPLPALANARITVLMDVLEIPTVVEILREEGLAYAQVLDEDMLDGRGGAFWAAQVRQIYAPDPITERLRRALETGLDAQDVEAAIAFFGSGAGQGIIALENAARRAMADPAVEEAARDRFREDSAAGTPRALAVARFMAVNDLLDRNVAGAMSSNTQFYLGLADGGYTDQTQDEIIAEVWAEEPEIRADTETWLGGFLLMAYQPLPDAAMQGYVDFSLSPGGQALNAALFDGFEAVYRDISYALGRAVALNAEGDEI